MNYTEQRSRLRALLAGSICHIPASVFDALSARVAESVGFEIVGGSDATLQSMMDREGALWKRIVTQRGIRFD